MQIRIFFAASEAKLEINSHPTCAGIMKQYRAFRVAQSFTLHSRVISSQLLVLPSRMLRKMKNAAKIGNGKKVWSTRVFEATAFQDAPRVTKFKEQILTQKQSTFKGE